MMARNDMIVRGISALARYLLSAPWADVTREVERLEALGSTPKADVDAIEAEARRTLRQDEPTQTGPLEGKSFVAKPRCSMCDRQTARCVCGGPLGEGD